MIWQSPMLPVQQDTHATTFLKLRKTPSESNLNVQIVKSTPRSHQIVNTIEEAEDRYISYAYKVSESLDSIPFCFNRQSAGVARRSRRGMANVWLMHPDIAERIPPNMMSQLVSGDHRFYPDFAPSAGRWWQFGICNKHSVWCCDHIPKDKAYVAYVNTHIMCVDAGASLLNCEDKHYLIIPDLEQDYDINLTSRVSDYITEITFV